MPPTHLEQLLSSVSKGQAQTASLDPLKQLLTAISDPHLQEEASRLITLSIAAVDDLSQLDEKIYQHHGRDAGMLSDSEKAAPVLVSLAEQILHGVRELEAHLQEQAKTRETSSSEEQSDDDDSSFGDDDGFSGFGESMDASPEKEPSIADLDLDGAFDSLGEPEPELSCQERWQSLQGELESFAYALGSQLGNFDDRFANAIGDRRFDQALRELNDVGRSVTDGVFALMTTIYETYLGDVDRDDVLPGHESTLSRALSVRGGLTDLRAIIHSANTVLQSAVGGEAPQDEAFAEIVDELRFFVEGEVFRVMRPADRLELKSFLDEVSQKTRKEAQFDCEGLAKYLDSLAAVSQRDVLIQHDRDQQHDIRELLEAAKPLLDISPHGALAMIAESFEKAESLYGARDSLDRLLAQWERLSPAERSDPAEAAAISQRLDTVVREMG